eukprot:PhM_4_TR11443/c0_g1_i1/m.63825
MAVSIRILMGLQVILIAALAVALMLTLLIAGTNTVETLAPMIQRQTVDVVRTAVIDRLDVAARTVRQCYELSLYNPGIFDLAVLSKSMARAGGLLDMLLRELDVDRALAFFYVLEESPFILNVSLPPSQQLRLWYYAGCMLDDLCEFTVPTGDGTSQEMEWNVPLNEAPPTSLPQFNDTILLSSTLKRNENESNVLLDASAENPYILFAHNAQAAGKVVWNSYFEYGEPLLVALLPIIVDPVRHVTTRSVAVEINAGWISGILDKFRTPGAADVIVLFDRQLHVLAASLPPDMRKGFTVKTKDADGVDVYIKGAASTVPILRKLTQWMEERVVGLGNTTTRNGTTSIVSFTASFDGAEYVCEIASIPLPGDETWFVMQVIPASHYLSLLRHAELVAMVLCGILGGMALILTLVLVTGLMAPLKVVSAVVLGAARMQIEHIPSIPSSRLTEITTLAHDISFMIQRLKEYKTYLPDSVLKFGDENPLETTTSDGKVDVWKSVATKVLPLTVTYFARDGKTPKKIKDSAASPRIRTRPLSSMVPGLTSGASTALPLPEDDPDGIATEQLFDAATISIDFLYQSGRPGTYDDLSRHILGAVGLNLTESVKIKYAVEIGPAMDAPFEDTSFLESTMAAPPPQRAAALPIDSDLLDWREIRNDGDFVDAVENCPSGLRIKLHKASIKDPVPIIAVGITAVSLCSNMFFGIVLIQRGFYVRGIVVIVCLACQVLANLYFSHIFLKLSTANPLTEEWLEAHPREVVWGRRCGVFNVNNIQLLACHYRLKNRKNVALSLDFSAPFASKELYSMDRCATVGELFGNVAPFVVNVIQVLDVGNPDPLRLFTQYISLTLGGLSLVFSAFRKIVIECFVPHDSDDKKLAERDAGGDHLMVSLRKRRVTVVHCSLRNFGELVVDTSPESIARLESECNNLYTAVFRAAHWNGGIVTHFHAAEASIIFNTTTSPSQFHESSAVACALSITQKVDAVCAIVTDNMSIGNLGTATRRAFQHLSRGFFLCRHLVAVARELDDSTRRIVVSESVVSGSGVVDAYETPALPDVVFFGRSEKVFAVVGERASSPRGLRTKSTNRQQPQRVPSTLSSSGGIDVDNIAADGDAAVQRVESPDPPSGTKTGRRLTFRVPIDEDSGGGEAATLLSPTPSNVATAPVVVGVRKTINPDEL